MARSEVEVRSGDGGPQGAASVTYFRRKQRRIPAASPAGKEAVSLRSIWRRSPRPDRNAVFGLHQQVEAFHGKRWRKGVVSKLPAGSGNGLYSVCFPVATEEFQFSAAVMRNWADVAEDQENHGELQARRETNGAAHKYDKCFNLPISGAVIEMGGAPVGCTLRPKEVNIYNGNEFAPDGLLSVKAFLELEDRSPINSTHRFSLSRESDVHDHNELIPSGSLEASVKMVLKAPIDPIPTGSSFSGDDIPDHDEFIPSRLSAEKATLDQGGRAEIDPAPSRPFTRASYNKAISVYLPKELDGDNKGTLPFTKMSTMWQLIESMDVFHTMPQQPHFKPLELYGKEFREGMAIGLMVTFENLVAWTKSLQITDPQYNFEEKFTCLENLESHGFNVQLLRSHLEKLLEMWSIFTQYESKTLSLKERIIEGEHDRYRLDALIAEHDKIIMELKKHLHICEERQTIMLNRKKNKDLEIVQLKMDLRATEEAYLSAVENFNTVTDAQW